MAEVDWSRARWAAEYDKHWPYYHVDWSEACRATQTGPRRYHPSLSKEDIQILEMSFSTRGKRLRGTRYWIIIDETRQVVGASNGVETNIVLIKVDPQLNVHGHPINREEYNRYVKKYGFDDELL